MKVLVITLAILLLSGCTTLKRERADLGIPASYQHGGKEGGEIPDRWWEEFGDEEINRLVAEVIERNYDIRIAAERVAEVRAELRKAGALLYPSIEFQTNLARQKQLLSTSGTIYSSSISVTLLPSYEIDLWGKLSSGKKAKVAELLSSEENYRAVIQGAIADAISLYLEMEGIERKIGILKERLRIAKLNLKVVEGRYRRGLISYLDLLQARTHLKEVESQFPFLYRQLKDVQQRLAILSGRYPETRKERSQPVDYFRVLPPVPPGLPSQLLLRRPDIRAKERQMEALYQSLRMARAARFPIINLTGSYGFRSNQLKALFNPENRLWQIALGIVSPIFDAGKLRAEEEAQAARYREGIIDYARTVLQAFYEVESGLAKREELYRERERLLDLLSEAIKAWQVAQERYRQGLIDLLRVLDLEDRVFQTRERMVDVETAILKNRVFLYRALGGGWDQKGPEVKGIKAKGRDGG